MWAYRDFPLDTFFKSRRFALSHEIFQRTAQEILNRITAYPHNAREVLASGRDAMAIQIKDPASVAAKWAKRASASGADYTSGVQNPRTDQAAAAAAAAPVWAQATADAASRDAFRKGVVAAGTPKWQAAASTIGAQRYPQGVNAGQANMAAKVAPYLSALSNLNLPPRGVKGTNNARVQAVVDALRKVKLGQ